MAGNGTTKDAGMEVRGFLWVGLAVLALVSLYASRGPELLSGHEGTFGDAAIGSVGVALASFQRGLVGYWGAWVLPILALLKGIHTLLGRRNARLTRRAVGCSILYLACLACLHLSNPNYLLPSQSNPDMWRTMNVAAHGNGGGIAGAVITVLVVALFGVLGSYILYSLLGLVSIFLIIDASFSEVAHGARNLACGAYSTLSSFLFTPRDPDDDSDDDSQSDGIDEYGGRFSGSVAGGRNILSGLLGSLAKFFHSRGKANQQKPNDSGVSPADAGLTHTKRTTPFGVTDLRKNKKGVDIANDCDVDGVPDAISCDEEDIDSVETVIDTVDTIADAPEAPRNTVDVDMQELISSGAAVTVKPGGMQQKAGKRPKLTLSSAAAVNPNYKMPPLDLLSRPPAKPLTKKIPDQSVELVKALQNFGIDSSCVGMDRGPHVTRYDIRLAPGTKYTKVANLEEDIALALEAFGVRISPIQGTGNIGIEVSNKEVSTVYLREVLESEPFQSGAGRLTIGMGKDIAGAPVVVDLAKMVHTLISGATGSGKSVCINTLITSLLYKARPEEVRLLMIDPKVVELSVYNDIPHLLSPVITDPKQAASSLKWVVLEMERRYRLFAKAAVRHLDSFNQIWKTKEEIREMVEEMGYGDAPIPYIVVIVDELADLMMVASDEVEDAICRLAQKARAAGIHLVLATQRPSTDVITGLIKANIPSRIAFAVASSVDSRVILDSNGAERLLGKGDMLCLPMGANRPVRVQGAFISDREVERVVEYVRAQAEPEYRDDIFEAELDTPGQKKNDGADEEDELLKDAVRIVLETQHASASMLQRKLSVGYARAARLIDLMEKKGMVGPHQGSKPREIMINSKHLEELSGS